MSDEPIDALEGTLVRVCHVVMQICETNNQSYTAVGKLGGVHQEILLAPEYVHDQIDVDLDELRELEGEP